MWKHVALCTLVAILGAKMREGGNRSTTLWRIFVVALVFLVMSCESDADGDGCLGSTDNLITGMSDGCGTGMKPIGDGCLGSCILGGDGGCNDCGAGDGCDMDCGACGDCGSDNPYTYQGDVVEGAIQVHATNSLFQFIGSNLMDIVKTAAGDALEINENGEITICVPPIREGSGWAIELDMCNRNRDCKTSPSSSSNDGCSITVKLADPVISTVNGNEVRVRIDVDDIDARIPSRWRALYTIGIWSSCHLRVRKSGSIYATVPIQFNQNAQDHNHEIYVGGDAMNFQTSGVKVSGCSLEVTDFLGLNNLIIRQVVDGIGALSCRGCDTLADCGTGATRCQNGTCRDNSGRMCQGIQVGMDVGIDAGSLLQSIDPAAEGALGLRAFLGSYVHTSDGGLQLGGRLGAKAEPQSLCVPLRPSPAQPGVSNCRTGDNCDAIADLNSQGVIPSGPDAGTPFHVGLGVAMSGLNQVLWSAYSSGMLCLSIGGESEGLEILGTGLIGVFIQSLQGLTYNVDQPIMIQLRPQQAPVVDFKHDEGQGAEMDVRIPELALDFYTVADQRYARIFTLIADIELPLGVKAENNELSIAIGDLANVIDPETVKVTNIEMVQRREVENLVASLPSVIGGAAGGLLGDDLIPSIEIPEIEGIQINLVGPGVTILEENGQPAALGIFAKLGFADEFGSGLLRQLEPVITDLNIDMMTPKEMRAFLAARRQFEAGFSYRDVMPRVTAQMQVMGADLSDEQVEYAYSINEGPWSFWKKGPALTIDHPMIANEGRYDVRITARRAGDPTSGSRSHAEFSFVNDFTAPRISLSAVGSSVVPYAKDNVYPQEELTMQYRINSGAWSQRQPIHAIDLTENLTHGEKATVDVFVEDPSGNARSIRQTFGIKESAASVSDSASAQEAAGCATSSQQGGWMAVLAFLALVLGRRRRREYVQTAASPAYIAIAALGWLLLALTSAGCVDNAKDLRSASGDCDPACLTSEICDDGVCVPITCKDDKDCPGSAECVDGACIGGDQYCNDADDCEYGHICKDGICKPSECSVSDECDPNMCDGDKLPFCDFDDYPSVEAGECVCENSLELRKYGTWLRVVQLEKDDVVAFTYNESYGDLMFGVLNEDDTFDWEFLDGVPEGPVVAPPTGARNGVRAPGDVAGRYVAAVAEKVDDDYVLHAVYQYHDTTTDELSLRYTRGVRGAAGWSWTKFDIDNLDAAGMFPNIVLLGAQGDDDDAADELGIGIVYMTGDAMLPPDGSDPAEYFSQVSTAYAPTRTPDAAEDFHLVEGFDQVAEQAPCANLCASNSVCLDGANVCVPKKSGCAPACASTDTCVEWEGQVQCLPARDAKPGFSVTSKGVGLFSSSVVDADQTVHTAYYDQVHGVLKYVALERDGNTLVKKSEPLIVDGELDHASVGDVGRWTNIHVLDDGRVVIFYEDAGRAELRAAVVQGNNVSITVLDDGVYLGDGRETVSNNRVGSSVFARKRSGGGFDVYYQDTTDLVTRKLTWTDLSAAPDGHPLPIYGTEAGFERDPTPEGQSADENKRVTAEAAGGYGFFINVHALPQRTLFSSKRIAPAGKDGIMDVQTGTLKNSLIIGPVDPIIVGP